MSAARPAVTSAASRIDEPKATASSRPGSSACRATPMSRCMPACKRGRDQRAEAGEGHLAERELAGPAGEHGQRQAADREDERSSRTAGAATAAVMRSGSTTAARPRSAPSTTAVEVAHPPDAAEPLGDRSPLGGERERLRLRRPWRLWKCDRDQHGDEQQDVDEAGLVEEVEPMTRLDDADRDAGDERPGGTTPCPPITAAASARTSVLGPSVARSRGRAASAPPSAIIDSVASEAGDRPTRTVETSFGLMPLSRARSRFSADALTRLAERACG